MGKGVKVMIFKCKNCDGNTIYSPEHHSMYCPYCDSEKSEKRTNDAYNIATCPDCGGELTIEEHTSALQCPYCDNYIILNDRVENEYLPSKIIPFKFSKEMVKNMLKDKFKRCVFAPTDFLSEARLNSMRGEYVPFWMYDYKTKCVYQGEGVKIRTWRTGNVEHTETSYYNVIRDLDVDYSDVPVDASEKMADNVMDLMEPYNYGEMVPFTPEYMSGFFGEKYNMTSDVVESRARTKMEQSANALLNQSISGYARMTHRTKNVNGVNSKTEYALLPVWKYVYTYNEIMYPFYINGQTGKIVGKVPISKKKVFAYGATLWGVLTGIMLLLGYIVERLA